MANRLAQSTSPYLLQHQHNPVDWWEWSPEAFAEAERRGVPIHLSIGYAACHWCHVMAHESFEDEETAALLNARFVNVKVDREERPDVDAVYMEAVQALTGHGGWPMTSFLTPKGETFFAGTYWPKTAGRGMPSFVQVLSMVDEAWRTQRDEVEQAGAEIRAQLDRPLDGATAAITPALLDEAVAVLRRSYDGVHGGLGGAPKFPPSMSLEHLLRHHARTGRGLDLVAHTCRAMASGGMYDQLAGGFSRYSVDAQWVVPHFEKMLYDNALLLRVYLHWWRASGDETARRVVHETAEFLLRDLRTPEGGFASALDADTDGVEGLTYAWTPAQLVEVLGTEDGRWAVEQLDVTEAGTFEHGTSVLQRLAEPDDLERYERYERVRTALLAARDARPQPGRDDKVVAAWNGLAIAALAEAGALLEVPHWVDAATAAADLLRDVHVVDGRLRRTSRDGVTGRHAGVLDDYGDVAEGLLALHSVTGSAHWLELGRTLLDAVLDHFGDGQGGFFDTADDAEELVRRPQDLADGPVPAGVAAAANALLTYAAMTGSARHREAAEAALGRLAPLFGQHARYAGWALAAAEALVAGPAEVVVLERPDLLRVARLGTSPGAVVVTGGLLAEGRGAGAAYVCRGFVCELPTTDEARLREQLQVVLP
jgi:uncharacterized protein YyaL (SSP411 family)